MKIPREGNLVFTWDDESQSFKNFPFTKPTILLTFKDSIVVELDWLQAEDYINEYEGMLSFALALWDQINQGQKQDPK